jgi:hypothetical protein
MEVFGMRKRVYVYIDYGKKKPSLALVNDSNEPIEFTDIGTLLTTIKSRLALKSRPEFNFVLESGAPKASFLYPLTEIGNVYTIRGKSIKDYRVSKKIKKTDTNDVFLIREYYQLHPEEFRKEEKEDLSLFIEFTKYRFFTKELVRMQNMLKAYKEEFGSIDSVLLSLHNELAARKEEITKGILKKFPYLKKDCKEIELKGLGPILLGQYLAFAHPKRFPTLTAWLRYLGLRAEKKYKKPELGFVKGNIRKNRFGGLNYYLARQLKRNYPAEFSQLEEDMKKRFNTAIQMRALNRLVTIKLKKVYHYYKR